MHFRPADDLLELSAWPVMGEEDFGSVAAGAGGPSFFIFVEDPDAGVEVRVQVVEEPPGVDPGADEVVEFSCLGPGVLYDPNAAGSGHELTIVENRGPHRVRLSIAHGSRGHATWDFAVWPASPAPAQVLVEDDGPA